jgi:hypothetical protein
MSLVFPRGEHRGRNVRTDMVQLLPYECHVRIPRLSWLAGRTILCDCGWMLETSGAILGEMYRSSCRAANEYDRHDWV